MTLIQFNTNQFQTLLTFRSDLKANDSWTIIRIKLLLTRWSLSLAQQQHSLKIRSIIIRQTDPKLITLPSLICVINNQPWTRIRSLLIHIYKPVMKLHGQVIHSDGNVIINAATPYMLMSIVMIVTVRGVCVCDDVGLFVLLCMAIRRVKMANLIRNSDWSGWEHWEQ